MTRNSCLWFLPHNKWRSHDRGREKVGAGGGSSFQTAIQKPQLQRCRKPVLLEQALQMKFQILVAIMKWTSK